MCAEPWPRLVGLEVIEAVAGAANSVLDVVDDVVLHGEHVVLEVAAGERRGKSQGRAIGV